MALRRAPPDGRCRREINVNKLSRIGTFGRIAALVLAAWAIGGVAPASAQGFFESLFGRPQPRQIRPEPLPPQASAYADPFEPRESRRSEGSVYTGRGAAFCVRTCDGRYFPLQRHAGASPAEVCRSLCPAAKTMVFTGGNIDGAVAHNGTRYADLDNAFAYRDKVVPTAPATARTGSGSRAWRPAADPTLRPGDIVATNDGLATFHGKAAARPPSLRRSTVRPATGRAGCPRSRCGRRRRAAGRNRAGRGQAPAEKPRSRPPPRSPCRELTLRAARSPRPQVTATRSAPATRSRTDARGPAARAAAAPSIMKSAATSPGPVSFGRMPA